MPKDKSEVLQGTLDLMVLKTLDAMGPLHGYGISRRLEQLSEALLQLNEGTVYASLLRLTAEGLDHLRLGRVREQPEGEVLLDHPRRTGSQLARETESWERIAGVIGRVLRLESQR